MAKWASISYPRSGATWIQYFVCTCLGRPDLATAIENIDIKNSPFIKAHSIHHKWFGLLDGIILCIRNYKECIPRHCKNEPEPLIHHFKKSLDPENWPSYIHPLQVYDSYKGRKCIIYYEDLIDNPYATSMQIANLFHLDTTEMSANFEKHWNRSIDKYYDGSQTKGKQVLHHSALLAPDEGEKWDRMIKRKYPQLFSNYLKRYEGVHFVHEN